MTDQEEIERLKVLLNDATRVLADARDCIKEWGSYADEEKRQRHDLEGDIANVDQCISNLIAELTPKRTECYTPAMCEIEADATGHISCLHCRWSAGS